MLEPHQRVAQIGAEPRKLAYRVGRSNLLQLRLEKPSDPPFVDEDEWDPEIITE
jgi:hypothetical protein